MGNLRQYRKQGRRRRSKEKKVRISKCVSDTLSLLQTPFSPSLDFSSYGGVWRIVDDESLREVANDIQDTQEWEDVKGEVTGLEDAVKEASTHKYFNYALLAMGGITLLVALFGYCGAKKENQCLLSLYSICVFIILLLQIAAIVFINVDDANIDFIKKSISTEAGKIDIDVEKLQPGSKFVQNLFFGVSVASPQSSSSSQSPYALGRGGRR